MLPRLNGQYALAIWDRDGQELFPHGQLGIKPLFWVQRDGASYSPSRSRPCFRVSLAHECSGLVPDYLTILWSPVRTPVEGIFKLEPAIRHGRPRPAEHRSWWGMSFAPEEREPQAWSAIVRECTGSQGRALAQPDRYLDLKTFLPSLRLWAPLTPELWQRTFIDGGN